MQYPQQPGYVYAYPPNAVAPNQPLLGPGQVVGHTVICEERQEAPFDNSIAVVLCLAPTLLCCVHGVHRCYLGDVGIGICQCLTLGMCGIWSLIDLVSMRELVTEANRREGFCSEKTICSTTTTYIQPAAQPHMVYQSIAPSSYGAFSIQAGYPQQEQPPAPLTYPPPKQI